MAAGRDDTGMMRAYGWFERAVSGVILAGMVVVICLATVSFLKLALDVATESGFDLPYSEFQHLFDRVLAAVIAVELAHSIRQVVMGKHGMSQLRTVVVIGMLAVVRKIIAVDVETASGTFLIGVAAAIVALAAALVAVAWVERRLDIRDPEAPPNGARGE